MNPTFRKHEIKSLAELEALITGTPEAVEPGFRFVASGVNLGRSAVELVGLDAHGSPALVALGVTGDDAMLFRMVEAYTWSIEYPESLRRLVLGGRGSAGWPPRVLFIAERLPESFLRKLSVLNFPAVDCFEFRCVEVDGTTGFYLDLVDPARNLRSAAPARPSGVSAAPIVEPPPRENATRHEPAEPLAWKLLLARLAETPDYRPDDGPRAGPAVEPVTPDVPAIQPGTTSATADGRLVRSDAVRRSANAERAQASRAPCDVAAGIDGAKIGVVRKYLHREFPLCTIYDFYEHRANAQAFALHDRYGNVTHLATVTAEFFDAHRDVDRLRGALDQMRLALAMRKAGQAGVRMTPSGVAPSTP